MDYISTKSAAIKFGLSDRRIQKLCESGRIPGAQMISGVWLIPSSAEKPKDGRYTQMSMFDLDEKHLSLSELCDELSISLATGKNWIKLGKLVPCSTEGKNPFFTEEYVTSLKKELMDGNNGALKSRRNKKYVSGNSIYKSYVSKNSDAVKSVQTVLTTASESDIELSESLIGYLLAECATQLVGYCLNRRVVHLYDYLNDKTVLGIYSELVSDLIDTESTAQEFISNNPELFSSLYTYEANEDILGLLYISLKNLNNRKATGSYYTPTEIVNKLIQRLEENHSLLTKRIIDPCCGTGNFLLQLPQDLKVENIHGSDIDETSVKIARINIALKYNVTSIEILYRNFQVRNYLFEASDDKYDIVIGNPPWGFDFSEHEKLSLKAKYYSANGKTVESYDVFIEQSIRELNQDGVLSFVLPEAILNVRAHTPLREFLIQNASIEYLEMLGNTFDKVQCPCIILQIAKSRKGLNTNGMRVNDGQREFTITQTRTVSAELFSFQSTDEEYEIIEKLNSLTNKTFIAGHGIFALGIVTGNNKEYITHTKDEMNEMVLKGSDVFKYCYIKSDNYIKFIPESFQQVAPTEYYRAKEKLLYRFICDQLVFAYDNNQTLSLNSCNILIPTFDNLSIKYVMAVLNSSIAQFFFKKIFNSVKVLRSHIEQIPIPIIDEKEQIRIIELVDRLMNETDSKKIQNLYLEIDSVLAKKYNLTGKELKYIQTQTNKNTFLIG